MIIIGIDPGKNGAIAVMDVEACRMFIQDMPIIPVGSSKSRTEVDGRAIADLVPEGEVECYIEDVWSLPHDGHVGAFNFGDKYGAVKGVMAALDVPLHRVLPNTWKKKMGCPAEKTGARRLAMKLFPEFIGTFKRVKDDGRAESSLIALYGTLKAGFLPQAQFTRWT
jgi:crossover junction endodeoxyribonuclease RuvC